MHVGQKKYRFAADKKLQPQRLGGSVQAWIRVKPNKSKETKGTAEDAEVNPHAQINALGKEDNSSKKNQAKWRHIGKIIWERLTSDSEEAAIDGVCAGRSGAA